MITPVTLAALLQRFFTQRLMQQRQASPHTFLSRFLPSIPEVRSAAAA